MPENTEATSTTSAPDNGAASSTADAADNRSAADSDDAAGYWKSEAKKLIRERDEAKAKARELESLKSKFDRAEAKRLEEAGQWKELAEQHAQKLADAHSQLERLAELEAREAARVEDVRKESAAMRKRLPKSVAAAVPELPDADAELRLLRALAEQTNNKGPTAEPASAPPATTSGGPPPYGTPEFLEWQRTAPLKDVTAAREAHRKVSWPWSK